MAPPPEVRTVEGRMSLQDEIVGATFIFGEKGVVICADFGHQGKVIFASHRKGVEASLETIEDGNGRPVGVIIHADRLILK